MIDFVNLNQSKGNYILDADGNTLLDVCGTELNPLGYNHPEMLKVIQMKFKLWYSWLTARKLIQPLLILD